MREEQFKLTLGFDHTWVVNNPENLKALGLDGEKGKRDKDQIGLFGESEVPAAVLDCEASGIRMAISTTQVGCHFYTGDYLAAKGDIEGKGGVVYKARHGCCIETQTLPNSPHVPAFPSSILKPGEKFWHRTTHTFSVI